MSLSNSTVVATAPQAVPRFVQDVRPAADAAATLRETRPAPAMAMPLVAPPSPTQTAAVSRSMVMVTRGTDGAGAPGPKPSDRTLKPYGVAMLPHAFTNAHQSKDANTASLTLPTNAQQTAKHHPKTIDGMSPDAGSALFATSSKQVAQDAGQSLIADSAEEPGETTNSATKSTQDPVPEVRVSPRTDVGPAPEMESVRD